MAKKTKTDGGVREGIVVDDQGYVPYNDAAEEVTPNVSKGSTTKGKNRGMGAALRGGDFTIA